MLAQNPSCQIIIFDSNASLNLIGPCNGGADESMISSKLTERAASQGIGVSDRLYPYNIMQLLLKPATLVRIRQKVDLYVFHNLNSTSHGTKPLCNQLSPTKFYISCMWRWFN